MVHMMVRHKVRDFDAWKVAFEEHGSTRKKSGCRGGVLLRSTADPNEVVMLLEWDSAANAQAFLDSQDLSEAMKRSGVTDKPDVYILDEVDRPAQ
jgi:quinol monooxygenase YgiN